MGSRPSTFVRLVGRGDKAGQLSVTVGGVEPVLLQGGLGHGRGGRQPWMALMSGRGGLTTTGTLEHYLVIELGILCYPRTCNERKHQGVDSFG